MKITSKVHGEMLDARRERNARRREEAQKSMQNQTSTEAFDEMRATLARDKALQGIAEKVLGLETLKTRYSDDLDFSDQAVWTLKDALEQAYAAGRNSR